MARIRKLLGLVAITAIVASVAACGGVENAGKVMFTTDPQNTGTTEGVDACKVNNTVTSVKTGTSFYSVYIWTGRLSDKDVVHEEDFKDGASIFTKDWDTADTKDIDCLAVTDDLSKDWNTPGEYTIKLTVGDKVVAEGKITVTE